MKYIQSTRLPQFGYAEYWLPTKSEILGVSTVTEGGEKYPILYHFAEQTGYNEPRRFHIVYPDSHVDYPSKTIGVVKLDDGDVLILEDLRYEVNT